MQSPVPPDYLVLVQMFPSTGSTDVALVDVGSGGVMATVQAVSPAGGPRGFWGGQIGNPSRLEGATLNIARATAPAIEEMLRGVAIGITKPTIAMVHSSKVSGEDTSTK